MAALTELSRLTVTLYSDDRATVKTHGDLSDLMASFLAADPGTTGIDDSLAAPADAARVTASFVVSKLADGSFKTGVYGEAAALMARFPLRNSMEVCQ